MPHVNRRRFLQHTLSAAGLAAAGPLLAAPGAKFRPPFAICNETFADWPLERVFPVAAACGYRGVEVAPFTLAKRVTDIPAARRAEIRRQAERAGVEVMGLHWLLAKTEGFYVTSPDAAVRRRTIAYLGDLARFCAELGGKVLVFGSPKQRNLLPGVSVAQAMDYATEVFSALMPVLEKTNTVLAIEPLSPRTTTFLTTAAEGAELARRVGSPRCRLHLDCIAMSTERAPIPELLRQHRDLLEHFHANDPNQLGPGMGKLDFHPIFATLAEINYRGWVSVEVFEYSLGGERIARSSIDYMKQCLP
jgi:sugar phosphate isomerase/epimerase